MYLIPGLAISICCGYIIIAIKRKRKRERKKGEGRKEGKERRKEREREEGRKKGRKKEADIEIKDYINWKFLENLLKTYKVEIFRKEENIPENRNCQNRVKILEKIGSLYKSIKEKQGK